MAADLRALTRYYLSGKRTDSGLEPIAGLGLRPALLAHYGDLDALRYDYPLILVRDATAEASVLSLSALFDGILQAAACGADAERLRHHGLRLEGEMRRSVASGGPLALSALWDLAESRLVRAGDAALRDSLTSLRARLEIEGEVIECDRDLPLRAFVHTWKKVQEQQAFHMGSEIDRLIFRLSDLLRAEDATSEAGLSADQLQASFSPAFTADFDFAAMSRVLRKPKVDHSPADGRRERIDRLLATLELQRFFTTPGGSVTPTRAVETYDFLFEGGGAAIEAYRERLPALVEFAKAMLGAGLEVDGKYLESAHAAVLEAFGQGDLGPDELAQFPSYLVCASEHDTDATAWVEVMDALSAGLPMKILVQTDDVLEPAELSDRRASSGSRVKQLCSTAIGMGGVYVLQTSSSHLYRLRDRILRGLKFNGPALFAVYSGAGAAVGDLPPYLAAAAAMESRAFPAFTYDPSAGPDWAARFSLDGNPQAGRDWPVQDFAYEDESLQRVSASLAFTLVDFAAADARFAEHFARLPKDQWNSASLIPVADCIANDSAGMPDRVPYLWMAGPDHALHRVLVDARLIQEARRYREQWRRLQQWGELHDARAEQPVARAEDRDESARQSAMAREPVAPAAQSAPAPLATAPDETAQAARSDEAFIETARCTSCNECTQINDRMFKYNENKQAYLADLGAGTYAQLVLAAESCQVAIIHPGKPRNPNEPGMEELLKRAAPFC